MDSKEKSNQKMICNPRNSCVDCKNNGINIKITNKCNCDCSFCIEKGGLDTEEKDVERLIDATNLLEYESVLVLGGEPLLYPHLESYLAGIKNKRIYLTTNGTLLDADKAEMLSRYLAAINISIHSYTEYTNALVYKIQDYSFKKIAEAITVFRKNNVPVRINCNLIKGIMDTRLRAYAMIECACMLGANSIRFAELQHCEDMYVDATEIFDGLPDDPYVSGCEQEVYREGDFRATVKMTCGFVNGLKEVPVDPGRKQTQRKVIYPDGEVRDGWYNIRDGKAEYHGKTQPTRVEYVNASSQSCY